MFDMKTEDFEQLKKLCQENDFEIDGVMNDEGVYFIRKKDPWDGVEFAENKATSKIIKLDTESKLIKDDKGNYIARDCYTPSTESAYVDQLKKEAFERLGPEYDKVKIDRSNLDGINIGHVTSEFMFHKKQDRLFWNGTLIYQSGKWATPVKERVEVTLISEHKYCDSLMFKFDTGFVNETKGIGDFLASQLEAYLNGEIHESVSVKELEKIRKQFFDKFK